MNKINRNKTSKVYPAVSWALPRAQNTNFLDNYKKSYADRLKQMHTLEHGYNTTTPISRKDKFKNYAQNILYKINEDKEIENREDDLGVDHANFMTKRGLKRRFNRQNSRRPLIPEGSAFNNVIGGGLLGDALTWGLSTIDEFRPGSYDLNPFQYSNREKRRYTKELITELTNDPANKDKSKREIKKMAREIADDRISTSRRIDKREYQQDKVINTSDEDKYYDKETGILRNYKDMNATLYNRFSKERSELNPDLFSSSTMDKKTNEIIFNQDKGIGDIIEGHQPLADYIAPSINTETNEEGFGTIYNQGIVKDKDNPFFGQDYFNISKWDENNPNLIQFNKGSNDQEKKNDDWINRDVTEDDLNEWDITKDEWDLLSNQEQEKVKWEKREGKPIPLDDDIHNPPNQMGGSFKKGGESKSKSDDNTHIVNAHMTPMEASLLEKDGTLPNRYKKKGISSLDKSYDSDNKDYDTVKLVKIDGKYKLVYKNKLTSVERASKYMRQQVQSGAEFKYSDLPFFREGGSLPKAQINNSEVIDYQNRLINNYGIDPSQFDYTTNMPQPGAINQEFGDVWGDIGDGTMGWVDEEFTPTSDKFAFLNNDPNNPGFKPNIQNTISNYNADQYDVRNKDMEEGDYLNMSDFSNQGIRPKEGSIERSYGQVYTETGLLDKKNVTPDVDTYDFAGKDNTLSRRQLMGVRKANRRQDKATDAGFASWDEMQIEKQNIKDQKKADRKAKRQKWGDTWLDQGVNRVNYALDSPLAQTAGKLGKTFVEGSKIWTEGLKQKKLDERDDKFYRSFTGDDVFTSVDADNRGHHDFNTGIGWTDEKIISRMGKYGTELKFEEGKETSNIENKKNTSTETDPTEAELQRRMNELINMPLDESNVNLNLTRGKQTSDLKNSLLLGLSTGALSTAMRTLPVWNKQRKAKNQSWSDYQDWQNELYTTGVHSDLGYSGWTDFCENNTCPSFEAFTPNRSDYNAGEYPFKGTFDNNAGVRQPWEMNMDYKNALRSGFFDGVKGAASSYLWNKLMDTRWGNKLQNNLGFNLDLRLFTEGGSLPKAQNNVNLQQQQQQQQQLQQQQQQQRNNMYFNRMKEVQSLKPFNIDRYKSSYPTIAYNQESRRNINQGSLMDLATKTIYPQSIYDGRYREDDQADYAKEGVEIDLDMYKQLLAAGADIEII